MSEPWIVVPLDGSDLAERAVPYATAFAKATQAGVLLVTTWEGIQHGLENQLPDLVTELTQRGEQYYRDYLAGVAKQVAAEGVAVKTELLLGDPTDEIMRYLRETDPQLLALATHGRSGLSRWLYGSVASRLVQDSPEPTLVIGPKVLEEPAVRPVRRILVPLDGSDLSQLALRPAVELAEAFGADLVLAEALRFATQAFAFGVPEVDIGRLDLILTQAAEEHLAQTRERLRTTRPVETRVVRGQPTEALLDLEDAEQIDLVVMASHGRGGIARVALGSVADRMLQGRAPVLLIRPETATGVTRAAKARHCHNCGRSAPYGEIDAEDRCLRCGEHLHACGNCVYFDGIACLLQRSEVHDAYPGRDCPEFQFRETPNPG